MNDYEYQKGGLSDDEYTELNYWQDVLFKAENEIEYWEGEKETALEMIEKLQGR